MTTLHAYLAGAIDSDGTIGIKRSTYSMRVTKESKAPIFSERIALRQVTPEIPALLQKAFGGSLYMTKPSLPGGRPLWSWAVTDLRAVACLLAILPYLRVKKEQGKNCLALRRLKEVSKRRGVAKGRGVAGRVTRDPALTERMEAVYARAKELNRVGA